MGLFPQKSIILAFASILSIASFTDVEARPIRKTPSLKESSVAFIKAPLKLEAETSLPTKEAKKCGGKRHRRGCDEPRTIRRVPITITRSGKYCVTRDLTYTGTGAAITVEADNVTINFANHSLFLTDPAAEGILVTDVEEFTLLNDKISLNTISNNGDSNAIHLVSVSKAKIDNIFTENTFRGIRLDDSNDVTITNTHHKNHVGGFFDTEGGNPSGSGIRMDTSSGVTIDNSFFEGSSGANHFQTDAVSVRESRNIIITNTKHTDVDTALFVAGASSDVLVDNLVASFSSEAFYGGINLGGATDEEPSIDIILRNVTITNLSAFEGWDGINVGFTRGLIFENIIIDTNTTIAEDFTPAALHFGCNHTNGCEEDVKGATDGLFSNVVINNVNAYGVFVEEGSNLVFDNLNATGSFIANVLIESGFGNVVKNSYVGDSDDIDAVGILVATFASSTTLYNNVATGNGTGYQIDDGALNTVVDSNRAFGNGNGIDNNAVSTQTYYNRSCGNSFTNCINVSPSNNPGDPSEVGENICCSVED